MKLRYKAYLGDAVYAEWDGHGRVVLTTEYAEHATNTITLEPEVLDALQQCLTVKRGMDHRKDA
jgi:hypothetical protein